MANMMGVNGTRVCEAKITFPDYGGPITGNSISIQGHAWAPSPNFQNYTLEYAPNAPLSDPLNWTAITTSTQAVQGGTLHNWDVSSLPDGRYTLRLTARNTQNALYRDRIEFIRDTYSDGNYQNATEIFANPLTYHAVADRNLTSGDNDWFAVQCVAGHAYEFKTSALTGDTDTILDLYQTNGTTRIARNDDYPAGTLTSRVAWTCTSSGRYYVRVFGWGSPSAPGSYRVHFIGLLKDGQEPDGSSATANPLTVNGPASHYSIVPAGDVDWMSFAGTAGQTYTMEVTRARATSPMTLDLIDTDGSTVLLSGSMGSDNRVRVLNWTCPQTGTYYLRAAAGSGAAGHYVARVYEKEDLLFQETFEVVGDDLWTPTTGNWAVSGGAYVDQSNADTPHYSHGGLTTWTDIVVDGKVRFQNPSSSGAGNAGIILRYVDDDSLIVARIRQDNRVQLLQYENGTPEIVASVSRSFSPGVTYPMRVTFEGPFITVDVGGTVMQGVFSPRFVSGDLALRSYGSQGVFDDLKVWRPGPGTLIDFLLHVPPMPPGRVGAPYVPVTLGASGGTSPYTFAGIGGNPPPPGLTVSAAGVISGTPTASGSFILHVKAEDSADRLRTGAVPITIVPVVAGDNSPPTVTFVHPQDGNEFPANTENLQVDVIDVSAVRAVDFRVNGGTYTPMTYMGTDRYESPLPLTEGFNTVEVRAEDYAANVGVSAITVELDTTPPILTLGTYQSGCLVTAQNITLDGTALDAVSVTVDGNPATTFDAFSGAWTADLSLIYGANQVTVVATDNFSRTATLLVDIYFRLKGDVDGDGDVDDDDALLTAQFEAGEVTPSAMQQVVGDVDENGVLDINDVYAIRRVGAGEMTFP
ncbi:MAG: hypothetical protein ACYTHN_17665 [Planctomycetota bacterium]